VPRPLWIASPAILVIVAFAAMLVALAYGGGADAPAIVDPGPVVLYGLPAAKLLVNLGGGVALGALLLTCFALDPGRPEFGRALDTAAAASAVWTVAAAITGFMIYTGTFTGGVSLDPSSASRGSRRPSSPPPSRYCASRYATSACSSP
jgi:hypothetical protein